MTVSFRYVVDPSNFPSELEVSAGRILVLYQGENPYPDKATWASVPDSEWPEYDDILGEFNGWYYDETTGTVSIDYFTDGLL